MAHTLPLRIEDEALEVMKADAVNSFPDECCGFFYGYENATRTVTLAVPVTNSKEGDKRRRFEVSPLEYMRAEQYADANGLKLLGVYHSHPLHPAIASEHDRAVAMPWFSYIILSVFGHGVVDVKSWQLNDERQFIEENILNSESIISTK